MILLQDGFESSHLVDSWLSRALQLGLDTKRLFESKICTSSLNRDTIQFIESYPDFHEDTRTITCKYEGGMNELIHDYYAYNTVFGEEFGTYNPYGG